MPDQVRAAASIVTDARKHYDRLITQSDDKTLHDSGSHPTLAEWHACLDDLFHALGWLYRVGMSSPDRVEVLASRMRDVTARMDRIGILKLF